MERRPPRSTRTDTLFPDTTLFRSANEAEFADAQASRMVQYATDAQIEEAIDNGGVMDGVQIAPGVLTQEKTRRVQAAIDQARSEERSVGKGCVSTCRSRWSPEYYK